LLGQGRGRTIPSLRKLLGTFVESTRVRSCRIDPLALFQANLETNRFDQKAICLTGPAATYPVNESTAKPHSRRLAIIVGSLVAAGVVGFFVLLPCTLREINSRMALGSDLSMWGRVDSAVRVYHLDHGQYPASLDTSDFQKYIDPSVAAWLREARLTYHPPAADSPPTFILLRLTTPRGECFMQLDGTPVYPNSK
jgi:hypothetical protein